MTVRTDYETLVTEQPVEHVLLVSLNRPRRSNAINTQMGTELRDLFATLYVDPDQARCVLLTGAGTKAFCAGADLKDRDRMTTETWQQQHAVFQQMVEALINCPIPIIAAVNGAAYGGGCELALLADFIYAARSARFALPETTLGIMPGAAGTQTLPRACGVRRAKEIILTGLPFSADQAHDWGVVNKLCPDETLRDEAIVTACAIAANAPIAIKQAKKSVSMASSADLKTGYAFEIEAYQKTLPTEDRIEGVRAFNEKRKPDFKGR